MHLYAEVSSIIVSSGAYAQESVHRIATSLPQLDCNYVRQGLFAPSKKLWYWNVVLGSNSRNKISRLPSFWGGSVVKNSVFLFFLKLGVLCTFEGSIVFNTVSGLSFSLPYELTEKKPLKPHSLQTIFCYHSTHLLWSLTDFSPLFRSKCCAYHSIQKLWCTLENIEQVQR